jgi:hypothetical protein
MCKQKLLNRATILWVYDFLCLTGYGVTYSFLFTQYKMLIYHIVTGVDQEVGDPSIEHQMAVAESGTVYQNLVATADLETRGEQDKRLRHCGYLEVRQLHDCVRLFLL